MIIDAAKAHPKLMPTSDVLVIGSGPVGLMLARALEKRGMRVLILESGPRESALPRTDICDVLQDGDVLDSVANARTRQVGGGLNLWGGQVGLLETADVNETRGWPLRHSEIYSHLEEVLETAGLNGRGVAEHLRKMFDPNLSTAKHVNQNIRLIETAWLPRPKLNRKFWQWLERSPSCHLWHHATCVGLNGSVSSSPSATVLIGSAHPYSIVVNSSNIVLAAGTIENARLLMLPSLGPEAQPWHRNIWLGRGFNDHLDASVGALVVNDRQRLAQVFDPYVRNGVKYVPKIVWHDRKASPTGLGVCGLPAYSLTTGQTLQNVGLLFKNLVYQPSVRSAAQFPKAVMASARSMAPLVARYMASRRIGRPGNSDVTFRISVEQRANWQSSLRLSERELDRSGIPRCVLTWKRGDAELHAMRKFAEAADRWLETNGVGRIEIDQALAQESKGFWNQVDSGLHHAGTTRIGRDEQEGVVDTQLRVHGTRGFYVCGASVFPSSGYINPTLTAMALAVRLAHHLASERRVA